MELAIDTSTAIAGIALSERGVVIEERVWTAGRNHTVELMPEVVAMLERHGTAAASLDAIFVATGPGSFSALRVGISAAKGLALGTGAPLVGVGTMWIEAAPFVGEGLPIRPILDAARAELSVGSFVPAPGGLAEVSPPVVLTVVRRWLPSLQTSTEAPAALEGRARGRPQMQWRCSSSSVGSQCRARGQEGGPVANVAAGPKGLQ